MISLVPDLGAGEAEVIALGLQMPGGLLILDDQLGRRIAALNSLSFTGTLGVLIRAKREGMIPSMLEIVSRMRARGMWFSDDIVRRAGELAGE